MTDTEKDKLFRGFERWRAAKEEVEPKALPKADAVQPIDTSAGAAQPIDTSAGGKDGPPNDWVMPY